MDTRQLDTMMLWFGVFALIALSGAPFALFDLGRFVVRRVCRARLRRRNLAVVAMIEDLQVMHEVESGADST
jgi:hypothetical protein